MRWYGIDPLRVFALPAWIINILIRYLPAIEASEQESAITTTIAPHLKADALRGLLRQLRKTRDPLYPSEPEQSETYEIVEQNPDLAAEWFAAMGARVVEQRGHDGTTRTAETRPAEANSVAGG